MAIVHYNPATKGRFTVIAHALLICSTFSRGVGVAYVVIVSLMVGREGVLDQGQRMVFNQFSLHGLLLGDLSEGVAYTLYFMFPLHTVFGVLGLLGVLCKNKLLVLLYTGFLTLALMLDIVLLVLTSILINGLTTWIQTSFQNAYLYYSNTWINTDLKAAWDAMFVNLECCGVTGVSNSCPGLAYTVGCWHKYYAPMTGYVWSLFQLFIASIILDVVGLVIAELAYQRLDSKPRCSSGICRQFGEFVLRSWKTNKSKFLFTVLTVMDTMAGLGLIVAGAVTLQSDFVYNSYISPLFGTLRFYNIYLPDLMLGLGVTMVTVGALNTGTCGLGYNILCFKSKSKIITARVLQITMLVVLILAFVFWFVMLYGVRDLMEFQLYKEFVGYNSGNDVGYHYTKSWQALFVTFTCCKIKGLEYRSSPVSAGIPEQCLYERTPINSNLDYVGATVSTGSYNQEFCEEKLSDEIYKYQVAVAVLFGIAICAKVYTMVYMFTKDNQTGDGSPRVPFSVTFRGLKSKKILVALVCVLVAGLLVSAGILITGAILKFDHVFGQKDIQHLFSYLYVSGDTLNFWMVALSNYLVIMGCVTLFLFGTAFVSTASGLPVFYVVTLIGFLLSVVVNIVAVCVWINVRVEIDWNMQNEMRSLLLNYYKTDSSDSFDYHGTVNLGFNFLFYEADCCGVDSIFDFYSVSWTSTFTYPTNPRTCHLTTDTVRWYTNRALSSFKDTVYTKGCGSEVQDSIHKYDVTTFVLLSLALVIEMTAVVLLDRRFKQTVSPDQQRGAFSTFLHHVKGHSVNASSHLPGLTAKILVFVSLTAFLMFAEIMLWVGVLVQTFVPGYLKNGFLENLNAAEDYSYLTQEYPRLDYLMYGLLICVFVMELVFVGIHVITIFAIRTLRKGYIYTAAVLLAFVIICDLVTLSLASHLINKLTKDYRRSNIMKVEQQAGYNCDDTLYYWSDFCLTNTATLFLLTGLFIGFNVVHILILCVLIGLAIYVSKNATSVTMVEPMERLSGLDDLSQSHSVQQSSRRQNSRNASNDRHTSTDRFGRRKSVPKSDTGRRTSIAQSTIDHRTSIAQSTTDRRTSIAQSTTDRRPSIAQSTIDRRTSIAQSTTDRRSSIDRSTTDRRSSVASIAKSVDIRSTVSPTDDNVANDDLETTYA